MEQQSFSYAGKSQAQQHIQTKLFIHDNIGFVELLEVFGSDLTVANAARVSFSKESKFDETGLSDRDAALITYLARHQHITPFFHPQIRMRIKMPIYVVREWYRHTIGFARNEVSRRYVSTTPECFVPTALRKRDKNIKQGSSRDLVDNNDTIVTNMREYIDNAIVFYESLLAQGVCPEQARGVLPQSMYTEFIETASLAGYARLAHLRLDASAQKEIQEYASLVSALVEQHFPVSWPSLLRSA